MSPTRRELVRETRSRVLDAAGRLTRERGPNGFSMDALAKEAGVARATVYEHFRSKGALLDELTASMARVGRIDESRPASSDPVIALRELLADVCRHWSANEEEMRELLALTAATGADGPREGVEDEQLRRVVEALAAGGRLAANWSVDEAVDMLATLTSYTTYEQLRRAPRPPDQVEEILAKLALSVATANAEIHVDSM